MKRSHLCVTSRRLAHLSGKMPRDPLSIRFSYRADLGLWGRAALRCPRCTRRLIAPDLGALLCKAQCACACAHACRYPCASTLVEHSPGALVHVKCFNQRALPRDNTPHPRPGAALRGSAADAPAFLLRVKRAGGCLTGASRGLTRDHSGVGSPPLRLVASFVLRSCRNLTFSCAHAEASRTGRQSARDSTPALQPTGGSGSPSASAPSLPTTLNAADCPSGRPLVPPPSPHQPPSGTCSEGGPCPLLGPR